MTPPIATMKVLWSVHLHFSIDPDVYRFCLPIPFQPVERYALPRYTISCFCLERDLGRSFLIARYIPARWVSGLSWQEGQYVLGLHHSPNSRKLIRKTYGKDGLQAAAIRGRVQAQEISVISQGAGLQMVGTVAPAEYAGIYWHMIQRGLAPLDMYVPMARQEAFRGYRWSTITRPLFPMGVYELSDNWVKEKRIFPAGSIQFQEAHWQSGNQLSLQQLPEIMRRANQYASLPAAFLLPHTPVLEG